MLQLSPSRKSRERRRNLRVTPDPLLIIRLTSGNHGIVLDLSHGGVGFLAGAPVEEGQEIDFILTSKSEPVAEGTGRLMWKDDTGKRAGLKFTHLPDELRAMLHSYLHREQTAGGISAASNAGTLADFAVRQRVPPAATGSDFGEAYQTATPTEPRETNSNSAKRNPKTVRWIANAVTAALASLIALGVWYSVDRRDAILAASHFKHGLSHLLAVGLAHPHMPAVLAKFTKKPEPQTAASSRPPAAESAAPGIPLQADAEGHAAAIPDEAPNPGASGNLSASFAPAQPPPAPITETAPKTDGNQASASQTVDQGQSELALAGKILKETGDPDSSAKASQLLWQAVGKGNTAAEIELADLYLAGEVLPKNCSQARILLGAARNRKSETAARKMDDLAKYGCE